MGTFELRPNDDLSLSIHSQERRFQAVEHPNAPGMAHVLEGRQAVVYRLRNLLPPGNDYALKVMKRAHQNPWLENTCAALDGYKGISGLVVCDRRCLSESSAPEIVKREPDLAFSILMPWVRGRPWFEFLYLGRIGRSKLSRNECLKLASHAAGVFAALETAGLAHCDVSPGNVLVDPGTLRVELVDVESLYSLNFSQPAEVPFGTAGYRHRGTLHTGHWNQWGDRFAGAILLAEMLGWYDERVRASSYGESYFEQDELHVESSDRFRLLMTALQGLGLGLDELLAQAWQSRDLPSCPPLTQWDRALAAGRPVYSWEAPESSPAIGARFQPFWAGSAAPPFRWIPNTPGGTTSSGVTWHPGPKPADSGPAADTPRAKRDDSRKS